MTAAEAAPLAIVLGTAGHIDHGKTTLVHALTGIDTDRLAVEKARGITTELGFAWLDLDGRRLAVVDVPGHERFVKSMVAGATGLDLVCLAIAADEGVMPQTREHLDICDLLGVRRGLVALTKRDLVEERSESAALAGEWLAMIAGDVRAAVAGTFLDGAPLVPVSAKTGAGLADLRAAITAQLAALAPRAPTGVFRLPIDRVFTIRGFGTVVTGTILGGSVAIGDELTAIPSGRTARVRGIEVHGAPVERALAGHRAALNLGGVSVDDLARGDLLAHPERVAASHILDVELRLLPTAPAPLPRRTKVLVHHATARVTATLALVDAATLAPGATALAQLRIAATSPLGALPGDRFIIRGTVATAARGATLGGGRIIRVLAPRARRATAHAETVAALAAAAPEQRIALDVQAASYAGLTTGDLVRRLGIPAAALAAPLAALVAGGDLLATGDGDHAHYLGARAVVELEAKLTALARAPSSAAGVAREALRTQLPAALPARAFDAILAGLVRRSQLVADADRVRPAAAPARPAMSALDARLLEQFRAWALEPPRPREVAAALGLAAAEVGPALDRLLAAKHLVRIKPDLWLHAAAVADLRARLVAFLDAHATIDAQQWKDLTGASRKFTIPIAEYFDAEKLTLRVGDRRRKR